MRGCIISHDSCLTLAAGYAIISVSARRIGFCVSYGEHTTHANDLQPHTPDCTRRPLALIARKPDCLGRQCGSCAPERGACWFGGTGMNIITFIQCWFMAREIKRNQKRIQVIRAGMWGRYARH